MSHNLCLGRDCQELTQEEIFCPRCDRRYGRRLCDEALTALLMVGVLAFLLVVTVLS